MKKPALNKKKLTDLIKKKAAEEGFYACGIAPVHFLEEDKRHFEAWLTGSNQGSMDYLERNMEARYDPQKLVEGSRSVISVLLNYNSRYEPVQKEILISKYTYGEDYHQLIIKKLQNIVKFIKGIAINEKAEAFVDSSPIFEKRWAQQAGLGWRGKNSILINCKGGSYFFLGEIVTTLQLEYDKPEQDHCGKCDKCIQACPTGALKKPYDLDARKCIAYLTIESKNDFNDDTPADFRNYIFGCDICQDVCPWNQNESAPEVSADEINKELLEKTAAEWLNMTEQVFKRLTKNSCIKRTGLDGVKRNIRHVTGQ
jgi:epoxyqueuosine reductase